MGTFKRFPVVKTLLATRGNIRTTPMPIYMPFAQKTCLIPIFSKDFPYGSAISIQQNIIHENAMC